MKVLKTIFLFATLPVSGLVCAHADHGAQAGHSHEFLNGIVPSSPDLLLVGAIAMAVLLLAYLIPLRPKSRGADQENQT